MRPLRTTLRAVAGGVLAAPMVIVPWAGSAGAEEACIPTSAKWRAIDLGTFGARGAIGKGINAAGQVAVETRPLGEPRRAVVWDHGRVTVLPSLGVRQDTVPADIDDAGRVAGYGSSDSDWRTHALVWTGGRLKDLGVLGGGTSAQPQSVSRGVVAGHYLRRDTPEGQSSWRAFVWKNGTTTTLPVAKQSVAADINRNGAVAGTHTRPEVG